MQIPDDRILVDLWISPYVLASLTAALEVGLLDSLTSGTYTADELARTCRINPSLTLSVMRVLAGAGILQIDSDKFYLTDLAASYFIKSSQYYRGREFQDYFKLPAHKNVVNSLRRDRVDAVSFQDKWREEVLDPVVVSEFISGMHSMTAAVSASIVQASEFSEVGKIVDVGGGSGAFASALATQWPNVSPIILDLPSVCREAEQYINLAVRNRISFHPADFFRDPWPENCDAVYFSNVLHDWPLSQCLQLLKKARKTIGSNTGRIFILEALLDDSRTTPLMTATFHLQMQLAFNGQQFTFGDLHSLLDEAGFHNSKVVGGFGYYSLVMAQPA